ncbi:stage II sporulation protein M [Candidatus Micrarchaeota archaeon]|nr:stage II sporulation protein M [Candidatus Micrarchaeota archaeon]MBI5176836.1 stage II sporulation protein M [Candidatus Micrarchaeota archaeon]
MVLESVISPQEAEARPWKVFLLAFVFAAVAVWLSILSGLHDKGVALVAIAAIACIPFVYELFNFDESGYEEATFLGSRTLARHFPVVIVLIGLFTGLVAGFTASYIALPSGQGNAVFDVQVWELGAIQSTFSGRVTQAQSEERQVALFEGLFLHNFQVLLAILAFSIFLSAGSVAILSWNSSIIGVFLGSLAFKAAGMGGSSYDALAALGSGILGILPHGSFELLAYLTAALAGGIMSSALIRRAKLADSFFIVVYDVAKLAALATVFLAIGAFIESQSIIAP